jgi:hypothetical protein
MEKDTPEKDNQIPRSRGKMQPKRDTHPPTNEKKRYRHRMIENT